MFAKVQHFEQSLLPIATNTSSARDDLKPSCIRGDIDIKSHDKNQAPSNRLYRQLRNGQVQFIDKLKTNFVVIFRAQLLFNFFWFVVQTCLQFNKGSSARTLSSDPQRREDKCSGIGLLPALFRAWLNSINRSSNRTFPRRSKIAMKRPRLFLK